MNFNFDSNVILLKQKRCGACCWSRSSCGSDRNWDGLFCIWMISVMITMSSMVIQRSIFWEVSVWWTISDFSWEWESKSNDPPNVQLKAFPVTFLWNLHRQVGFLSGLSMFSPGQALLSIGRKTVGENKAKYMLRVAGLHGTATVAMAYLILDLWDCGLYWYLSCSSFAKTFFLNIRDFLFVETFPRWIFAFCSCFPAVVELIIMVGVLGLKKPV